MNLFRVFINLFQFNRTNWKAVTLCVLAAAVFWLFNALNKDHSTTLRFPVMLLYDENRFVPASSLPRDIAINVHGSGWDLVRKSLGLRVPTLTVPVEKPLEVKRIPAGALTSVLTTQLGTLRINYIVTDSLHVPLDERFSRRFKVAGDVSDITFKSGFSRISPVIILPDSVQLSGPRKLLATLPDSITLHLHQKKIDANVREQVEVAVASDFISRNPPVVDIMFEVGPVEEMVKWLKIRPDKMPWGAEIERDTVRAVFEVPQRDRDFFKSYAFNVSLDLNRVKKGETKYLRPVVNELPAWAKLLFIDSVKVKHY